MRCCLSQIESEVTVASFRARTELTRDLTVGLHWQPLVVQFVFDCIISRLRPEEERGQQCEPGYKYAAVLTHFIRLQRHNELLNQQDAGSSLFTATFIPE